MKTVNQLFAKIDRLELVADNLRSGKTVSNDTLYDLVLEYIHLLGSLPVDVDFDN